jgi:hypothetical protein
MEILGEHHYFKAVDRQTNWEATKYKLHRYGKENLEDAIFHARLRSEAELNQEQTKDPINVDWLKQEIRKEMEEERKLLEKKKS